jgi:hypothetical protein
LRRGLPLGIDQVANETNAKGSPMKSVAEARVRVESEYRDVVEWIEGNDCKTAAFFECELWRRVLALGAALFGLFFCCRIRRPRPERCEHGGRRYVLGQGGKTGTLGTKFGKVPFWQPLAERIGKGSPDFPVSVSWVSERHSRSG